MRMDKYVAFARMAAVQAVATRAELFGRLAFVAVILGVFSALWRAVAEGGMPLPADRTAMIWYLATTEWIVLSAPPAHVDIEADIRRGDIVCQLARPFSYPTALLAQGAGALVIRAPLVGLMAFVCAWAVTGHPPALSALVQAVPFAVAAMLVVHGLYVLTGLTAFWLGDVSPLFWVWQKLMFVLGGLILPLAIYPDWLQRIAWLTPFPSLIAGPAGFMLGNSEGGWLALHLSLWALVVLAAVHLLFQRALRTLQVSGG